MTLETATRWAVIALATIAVFVALEWAEDVFAPVMLGLVIGVVLSPVSHAMERRGAPGWVSALLVMAISLIVLSGIVLFLGPVLSRLVNAAPQIWLELRDSIRSLQDMLGVITDASEEVARAISPDGTSADTDDGARVPSITDAIFAAPAFAAQLLIVLGTLFFFVMSQDEIYDWIAERIEGEPDAGMGARLKAADGMVSRYFLAITVINCFFGGFVALAMALIDMPQPVLWGVIATLLNFILYLGPALVTVMLLVAGVVVYDGLQVLLPPVLFIALNITEGQFVTPALIGRRMSVNPLLVFFSLVFWLWLWGPLGGFIAIPLLLWVLAFTGQLPHPGRGGYWAASASVSPSNSATSNRTSSR